MFASLYLARPNGRGIRLAMPLADAEGFSATVPESAAKIRPVVGARW